MMSPSSPINGSQADPITRHELEALGLVGFTGEIAVNLGINHSTGEAKLYVRTVAYTPLEDHPLAKILPFADMMVNAHLSQRVLHQLWCMGGCYLKPEAL